MAKPDWGKLQMRFLSEHAATGISPKEWCEANKLNYVTARRYIKKANKQDTRNNARKIGGNAQKIGARKETKDKVDC